jgi:NAD(P)-dependent dehydrogenase (short-subunit alcohol dehydrogenase family)
MQANSNVPIYPDLAGKVVQAIRATGGEAIGVAGDCTDLTATFLTLKSFLPGMIERGRGAIVTMASG